MRSTNNSRNMLGRPNPYRKTRQAGTLDDLMFDMDKRRHTSFRFQNYQNFITDRPGKSVSEHFGTDFVGAATFSIREYSIRRRTENGTSDESLFLSYAAVCVCVVAAITFSRLGNDRVLACGHLNRENEISMSVPL